MFASLFGGSFETPPHRMPCDPSDPVGRISLSPSAGRTGIGRSIGGGWAVDGKRQSM